MAFHPFRTFRKHQKAFFAVMAIVCMITFVLCSSVTTMKDEFFANLLGSLLSPSQRGEAVTNGAGKPITLYGKKVSVDELVRLREQKAIVSGYLAAAGARSQLLSMREEVKKPNNPLAFYYQNQLRQYGCDDASLRGQAEASGIKGLTERQLDEVARDVVEQLAERVRQGQEAAQRKAPIEELLDFMLWRWQADKLGIQLTTAGVDAELLHQRGVKIDRAQMEKALTQSKSNFPSARLSEALADEVRVPLAQEAITGVQLERNRSHPIVTAFAPHDFWRFYRNELASVQVALLPIRVEDLVREVRKDPTEQERLNLYNGFKNNEQDPASDKPGFKQPRRVRVEWVGGRADSPRYQRAAELVLAASQATVPAAYEALLLHRYENEKWPRFLVMNLNRPESVGRLVGQVLGTGGTHGPAVLTAITNCQEEALASEIRDKTPLVAALLAASNPLAVTTAGLVCHAGRNEPYVPFATAKQILLQDLQVPICQSILFDDLSRLRNSLQGPDSKPEQVVARFLIDRGLNPGQGNLIALALAQMVPHADASIGSLTQAIVAAKVAEFDVFARALNQPEFHGGMKNVRSRYDISQDPGLKPLQEAFWQSEPSKQQTNDQVEQNFRDLFFDTTAVNSSKLWYSHARSPRGASNPDVFVFWKTEDRKGQVPSYQSVRAEVDKTWRVLQARELAGMKAQQLQSQAGKTQGDLAQLRELALKHNLTITELLDLDAVAHRKAEKSLSADTAMLYKPYRLPRDKVPNFPDGTEADPIIERLRLPGPAEKAFIVQLLALQKPGDTAILSDPPQATYYLAVLVKRTEPNLKDFYDAYAKGYPGAVPPDRLLSLFEQQQRQQYIGTTEKPGEAIKALRIESGAADNMGSYDISPKSRKEFEGQRVSDRSDDTQ